VWLVAQLPAFFFFFFFLIINLLLSLLLFACVCVYLMYDLIINIYKHHVDEEHSVEGMLAY